MSRITSEPSSQTSSEVMTELERKYVYLLRVPSQTMLHERLPVDLASDKATSTRANSQISPTCISLESFSGTTLLALLIPSFVMLSTLFLYNVPSSLPAKGEWAESHVRVLRIICHMATILSAKPGRDSKSKSSLECHSGLALSAKVCNNDSCARRSVCVALFLTFIFADGLVSKRPRRFKNREKPM
ncbi:hypothetical protein F5146DRAFT_724646 [Armillaria mellea]|nr:hypothetical protein F5146DRAFT_724646 [Armillaria mellea]